MLDGALSFTGTVRKGLSKVTFVQKLEQGEGERHADIRVKDIPGREEPGRCREGSCLVCPRHSKEARVGEPREERSSTREAGLSRGEQGSDVCGACGGGGPKLICKNSGREGFGDSGVDNSFKGLCLEGNRNGADTGERSGANTA